jgi:hypothetical protein
MAAMICPTHGAQADGLRLCPEPNCFEFLTPEEPEPAPPQPVAGTCAEPGCGTSLLDDGRCPVHAISLSGEVSAQLTRVEARPDAPSAATPVALEFPFGAVGVGSEELRVGRSPDSGPLAARLGGYDNVSRHHARIWREGGELYVADLDSTNGTFVNDVEIPAYQPRRLRVGDIVRFGADLRATVRSSSRRGA